MAAKPPVGSGRALVPSSRARQAIVKRLSAQMGAMTTAVMSAIESQHPWFRQLGPEERSWITLIARSGIDGFISWFNDDRAESADPSSIFNAAPRALTRKISLNQTVDLVRTTIQVVEDHIHSVVPRGDRPALQTAIVYYSREIAFGAAEVYARAAESRGSWDERIEALVIDAIVRADNDESLLSRASTLGWPSEATQCVAVGEMPAGDEPDQHLDAIRHAAEKGGHGAMAAAQGDRLICVLAGADLDATGASVKLVTSLADYFGPGRIVVGPVVKGISQASNSARAAISGVRSSIAWVEGPRVVTARELLPERALAGNGQARRELVENVFRPLNEAGGDLMQTTVSFLDNGGSVEATARALYVHANTVRYRIKRILDVTGYSPAAPRDAYVLRLAITLGRLQQA